MRVTPAAQRAYVSEFIGRLLGMPPRSLVVPEELESFVFRELSRQEETSVSTRDQWDNWEWPYSAAALSGTLYRPRVDERVMEWGAARAQPLLPPAPRWPGNKPFALCLTHDVDFVSRRSTSIDTVRERFRRVGLVPSGQRRAAAYQLSREVAKLLLSPALRWRRTDEFHNFDQWMDLEAEHGFRSTFFFFAEHLHAPHRFDTAYSHSQRVTFYGSRVSVGEMMRRMGQDGWEIGLHASIRAATDLAALEEEKRQVEDSAGRPIDIVRHHYLSYDSALTPALHHEAGFKADSTHGFNRNVGFRAGTSFPYYCWNGPGNTGTRVLEVPMIIHDVALFGSNALECDARMARHYIVTLMDRVESVGGCLTVNWHPSWWSNPLYADSYRFLLAESRQRGAWGCSLGDLIRHVDRGPSPDLEL